MSDRHSISAPTLDAALDCADGPDPVAGTNEAAIGVDDQLSVMLLSCQDKLLVRSYEGLPTLSYVLPSTQVSFIALYLLH